MGMGTQARQLHSPQTSLGSLCACLCVCTPLCVSARVLAYVLETRSSVPPFPPCSSPKMPGWSGPRLPLFGQEGVPSGPPS